MKNSMGISSFKTSYMDFFCIILLLFMNPVSHFITFSPNIFHSDTIAYATMARDLFTKGLLYIPSWGHIDHGLILPPFYPFLIACGRFFSTETLNVAEYINSICALIFSVMIFLYLKQMTNRVIAVVTVILIQINYFFFLIGMRPLSEATFLLTLSSTFYLILLINKHIKEQRKLWALFLGLSCGLVFLSRQIGIIVIVFTGIICLLQWLTASGKERKIVNGNILFILLGWLIILVPYTVILYSQTGHSPLTQGFKKYNYAVTVKEPEILKEIEEYRALPQNLLKQIEGEPGSDYGILYAERRRMRKLLPDASEMYSYITMENGEGVGYLEKMFLNFKKPKDYLVKIYKNIIYLGSPLGFVLITLFFIFCFSPFLITSDKIKFLNRVLLLFFIILYLLTISFFTDKVPRYIYIIFPFCLMHISIELYICFNVLMDRLKLKRVPNLVLSAFILSLIFFTTPQFFTGLKVIPKTNGVENGLTYFKKYLNGAPVFSLVPYYSYIAGGSFRILPDDSLDKVSIYGKKTGVSWLLIVRTSSIAGELKFYNNSQWYYDQLLEERYPDLVKFRIGTNDGVMALYEFL